MELVSVCSGSWSPGEAVEGALRLRWAAAGDRQKYLSIFPSLRDSCGFAFALVLDSEATREAEQNQDKRVRSRS